MPRGYIALRKAIDEETLRALVETAAVREMPYDSYQPESNLLKLSY